MATIAFEDLSTPAHNLAAGFPELHVAQAEPAAAPPPPAPVKTIIEVAADLTLTLPPDATIDQPRINGTDLEFVQPDGSVIVVPNGAVTGLVIIIGDATIPADTVATIFASNNIETAAGPEAAAAALQSSGGNFATPVPGIGDGLPLIDLLGNTDFGLPGTELEDIEDGLGFRPAAAVDGSPSATDTRPLAEDGSAFFDDEGQDEGIDNAADDAFGDAPGTEKSFNGNLLFDYGPDGRGTGGIQFDLTTFKVTNSNGDPLANPLTGLQARVLDGGVWNTVTITVDLSADGQTLTGTYDNGAKTAFTIAIFDQDTGAYSISIDAALVHPFNTNNGTSPGSAFEDELNFSIGYVVTDATGTPATATLSFGVDDDMPEISVGDAYGDEESEAPVTLTPINLDESHGADVYSAADGVPDNNGATDDVGTIADPTGTTSFGRLSTSLGGQGLGAIEALFGITAAYGADGPQDEAPLASALAFTLVDTNAQTSGVKTTLSVTQPAAGGNPDSDPSDVALTDYADPGIYLVRISGTEIWGLVGPVVLNQGVVTNDIALKLLISFTDPTDLGTAQVVVEQFMAIDHGADNNAFDTPAWLKLADNEGSLGLTLTATATDGDGDAAVSAPHTVTILDSTKTFVGFDDDGPRPLIAASKDLVCFELDEDALLPGANIDDDAPDGEMAGSGLKSQTVSGNLDALVDFGRDGKGGFGLAQIDADDNVSVALTSRNGTIHIISDGTTLTGYVEEGVVDRNVFTLVLNSDGSFTFNLLDQVDHTPQPAGTATEDYLANALDLSAFVLAIDGDGDSVALATGAFTVQILDDIPRISVVPATVIAVPGEDIGYVTNGIKGGNETYLVIQGDDDQDLVISAGDGDGPVKVNWNNSASIGAGPGWIDPSDYVRIDFAKTASTDGSTYTAASHYSVPSFTFKVEVQGNSSNTASIFIKLFSVTGDNTSPGNYGDDATATIIDILVGGVSVIASATAVAGGYVITGVPDADVKVVGSGEFSRIVLTNYSGVGGTSLGDRFEILPVSAGSAPAMVEVPIDLRHDETAGVTFSPPNVADDEADPNLAGLKDGANVALGFARSQTSASTFFTFLPGADEPGSISYAVVDANGDAFDEYPSGLKTTDGRDIVLTSENGILIGYAVNDGGPDDVAFKILATPTGEIWIGQYLPIRHVTAGSTEAAFDDIAVLAARLHLEATLTDADGDSVTAVSDKAIRVEFQDDGPKANADIAPTSTGGAPVIVNVSINDTAGADGVDWTNTKPGSVTWTSPAHGTVTYGNNGTFTYTPATGYEGADSFTYTIKDGDGDTSTASVSLNTNGVVLAANVSANANPLVVKEDGSATVTFSTSTQAGTDDVLISAVVSGLKSGVTYSISGYLAGAAFLSDGSDVPLTLSGTSAAIAVTVFGPPDSDADLGSITVEVTAVDGDNVLVKATNSATAVIRVDAVLDDAIDLSGSPVTGTENTATAYSLGLTATVIHPFPASGSGLGEADTDGSESGTAVITLTTTLPSGAVLSFASDVLPVVINPTAPNVWTLSGFGTPQQLQAAINALQVSNLPAGFDGAISGSLTVQFTDTPTDTESTTADNTHSDTQNFSVAITPVISTPTLQSDLATSSLVIKEDGSRSFTLTAQAGATDVVTSVTISGLQDGASYLINGVMVPGSEGSHTVTFGGTQTTETVTIVVTPLADSDVDLGTITAFATAKDADHRGAGDPGQNSATVPVPVVVDAILDDAPNLGDTTSVISGTEVLTTSSYLLGLTALVIHPFTGSGAGGPDTDGSELRTAVVTLSAELPSGAVLSFGPGAGPVTIAAGADPKVWTLSNFTSVEQLEAAIEALQVGNLPSGFDGNISGTLRVTFAEATPVGATEPDGSDNFAEDSQSFSLTVAPAVAAPTVTVDTYSTTNPLVIKEDNGGTLTFHAARAADSDDVLVSATVSGLMVGTQYAITGYLAGAVFTASTSSIDVTFAANTTAADIVVQVLPNIDSDADLGTIQVQVTAADGNHADVKTTASVSASIVVDAVLDEYADVEQSSVPTTIQGAASQTFGLNLTLGFANTQVNAPSDEPRDTLSQNDTDGSETFEVTITVGSTANAAGVDLTLVGAPVNSTLLETSTGSGIWTLTVSSPSNLPNALAAVHAVVPSTFSGMIDGEVKAVSTDPGDPGDDTSDNTITDTASWQLTVTANSKPSGGTVAGAVDDEGLPHGIKSPQSGDDLTTDKSSVSGQLAGGGGDGAPHFAFTGGSGLIGQENVNWVWDPATSRLVGTITDGARIGQVLFIATLTDAGAYQFSLQLPVRHLAGNNENDASISLSYVVSDSDDVTGSSDEGIGTLNISLDDDMPVAFAAQPMIIENGANAIGSGQVNFYESIGADGGSVVFTGGTDGVTKLQSGGVDVLSGGKPIYLYGFGGTTLTGKIDLDGVSGNGHEATVFTVKLQPNASDEYADIYTVQLLRALDDGSQVTLNPTALGFTSAGSNRFNTIDRAGSSLDLLVSGGIRSGSGIGVESVNTNASSLGIGPGQAINDNDVARFDFVSSPTVNGSSANSQTYNYGTHYLVNSFGFNVMSASGSPEIWVRAYKAPDNDPDVTTSTSTTLAASHTSSLTGTGSPATITEIRVNGVTINLGSLQQADGGYLITGLATGDVVQIVAAGGLSRIELENPGSAFSSFSPPQGVTETAFIDGDDYKIGAFTYGTLGGGAGSPLDLSFSVTATDADGDTATGTISIKTTPPSLTPTGATTGDDLLVSGNGGETISGLGGNDVLVGGIGADVLDGGAANDTVSYQDSAAGVTVDLNLVAVAQVSTGDASGDKISNTENVIGSAFGDTLTGDSGPNTLVGLAGKDTLIGLSGNDFLTGGDGDDLLIGGTGIDEMTGGTGKDTFVIDVESLLPGFDDVIIDFAPTGAGDVLDLSDLLPGITTATNLATGGYVSLDSNGTDTAVFVDANGGGDNYQQVAVLKSVGTSVDITILLDDGTTTVTTI